MIPRELEVGGLHSYREPTTIPFDEAVEDGLFGIFGPTGSGKSTLLDAMTLALYDRVDRLGGNEKTPMMNVDADELTVTYTFELGGNRYQAHRRWVRADDAAQQRDAELRDLTNGETLASQAREVTRQVTEMLGMDFEQFTRAVFLPQGKFARFLEDSKKKRLELLEEIFGLDRYGEQLRERARDRRDELKETFDRIEGTLEELDDVNEDAVAQLAQRVEETAETVETLAEREAELDEDAQRARKLLDTLADLERAREQRETLEERADEIDAKRRRLARAEAARDPYRTLEDLTEARDKHAEAAETIEALEARADEQRTRLAEAEAEREEQGEALDEQRSTLDDVRTRLEALASDAGRLDDLRQRRADAERTLEELSEPVEEPPDDVDDAALTTALDAVQAGQRACDERRRHDEDRRQALADRGEARVELAELAERRTELAGELEQVAEQLAEAKTRLEEARVADRATVLAARLSDGEPCPVCGSDEHPDPAEATDASIEALEERRDELQGTREARERERARLDQKAETAEEQLQAAREASREAREAVAAVRETEASHRQALPDPIAEADWDEARARIDAWRRGLQARDAEQTIADVGEQLEQARQRFALVRETLDLDAEEPTETALDQARQALEEAYADLEERREQLETQVEAAEEALDETEAALDEVRGRASTLAEQTETLADRLEAQLADTDFADETELAEAHEPADVREGLRETVEAFDEERQEVEAEIERLAEQAQGTSLDAEAAEELIAEHERVETKLGEAREHHGQLTERLANLRERLQRKQRLVEQRAELETELTRAQRLTRLLGARSFIEYLARSRFEQVLRQASHRLAQVSGGRYQLEGTPSEIRVVDHMAGGEERDLRTLSGGETFMVSLSLALALSDAIQHERGGGYPPIEFFFLDEGFGSLDGDRLDQVMRMLHELVDQDVHVGLITHVEEARHYVPRSVLVDPASEDEGSTVEVRA